MIQAFSTLFSVPITLLIFVLLAGQSVAQVMRRTVLAGSENSPEVRMKVMDDTTWPKTLQVAWRCALAIDGDSDLTSALQLLTVERLADEGSIDQAVAASHQITGHRKLIGLAAAAEGAKKKGDLALAQQLSKFALAGIQTVGLAHMDALRIRLTSSLAASGLDKEAERLMGEVADKEARGPALAAWLKWQDPHSDDESVRLKITELETYSESMLATPLFNQATSLIALVKFWRQAGRELSTEEVTRWCQRAIRMAEGSNLDMTEILLDAGEILLEMNLPEQAGSVVEPMVEAIALMSWGVESTPAKLLRLAEIESRLQHDAKATLVEAKAWEILQSMGEDLICTARLLAGAVLWKNGDAEQGRECWRALLKVADVNVNPNIKRQVVARILVEMNRMDGKADAMWKELSEYEPNERRLIED